MRHGTLMAAPFDERELEVKGGSIGLVAGVMQAANMGFSNFDSGAGQFTVSESGSLAYVAGGPMPDRDFSLVWVHRDSRKVTPLRAPPRYYLGPRLSPDERRVAVAIFSGDSSQRNVWVHDIDRSTMAPVTSVGDSGMPVWTQDGSRLVFPSSGAFSGNLFWAPANGSARQERLSTSEFSQHPSSIARDGTLAFVQGGDLWVMKLDGTLGPRRVFDSPHFEGFPDISPDGRWLAYVSAESGRFEVWVRPLSGPGDRLQVSTEGGQSPAWRKNGAELFFHSPHGAPPTEGETVKMMAVAVTRTSSGLTFGAPTPLFEGPYFPSAPVRSYDVTRDGQRFLMVQMNRRSLSQVRDVVLVQNWIRELRERVR
jgi:hypothetical protein